MPNHLSPTDLVSFLAAPGPHALIDVRDAAEYNSGHIASSSLVPRAQLESRMLRLVPYRGTPVSLYDDSGRRASLAATTLERMGYTNVSVLDGGLQAWTAAGQPVEWGMNVPSKDFGEKVLIEQGVPEITPQELYERIARREKIVLVDARTPEEHRRDCIPGSRSVPGGELALRIHELVPDSDATVVVHCAGRTRSIIGAQTLRSIGLHKVYALQNGTMGWILSGLELETGSTRASLPEPSPDKLAQMEAIAAGLMKEHGVRLLDPNSLRELQTLSAKENVYLIDVRTEEEYTRGHIPGFWWMPGGQAVQRSDDTVAVRAGHVVFACDGVVRSAMTAVWYRQMGFPNVYVVDGGTRTWTDAGSPLESGAPDEHPIGYERARTRVQMLSPEQVQATITKLSPLVLFVDTSTRYSQGHLSGSYWLPRGWLELKIAELAPEKDTPIIVTCADGIQSALAAATLREMGYPNVAALDGGISAWRNAGLPLETGLSNLTVEARDDVRAGAARTREEMLHYLSWEEELGRKYERQR